MTETPPQPADSTAEQLVGDAVDEPSPATSAEGDASRSPRRRTDLTPAEREFLRRYAEDAPPHHDSDWG